MSVETFFRMIKERKLEIHLGRVIKDSKSL